MEHFSIENIIFDFEIPKKLSIIVDGWADGGLMTHFLLKSSFFLGALAVAYSCSNDPSSAKSTTPESCQLADVCYFDSTSNYVLYSDAYLLKSGKTYTTTSTTTQDYLIYPELGIATDANGFYMGKINGQMTAILGENGPIVQRIDLSELEIVHPVIPPPPEEPKEEPASKKYKMFGGSAWVLHADADYLIYSDGKVSDENCNIIAQMADPLAKSNIVSTVTGETLVKDVNTKDLTVIHQADNLTCPTNTSPSTNSSTTTKSSSSTINPSTPNSTTPKTSSSATPKSSSSTPKTSGGCPVIKTKGGGGSGWATRYWDCCKPSCSWNENAGGNPAKQCDANGKNQNNNYGAQSVCSGGNAATCLSQIPFTVSGCTEYGFAFAAVPASNGGQCGKCFQLTFTGECKYGDCPNCRKLANAKKKLIVMVTNIGGDVNQGQFDIMIPGGGVGMFNGCSQMGWGNQGEQYGGLLSNCETETGYSAGAYASCLENKCNSVFSNDAQAKEGCLFLANWMQAASNPMHNYVEVECPDVLKNKY